MQFLLDYLLCTLEFGYIWEHIAKLTVETWQLRSDDDKEKKSYPKKAYKWDRVRRTENTNRRFYSKPQLTAEITGVDLNLIYRIKAILEIISSGHKADLGKFGDYFIQAAKFYTIMYVLVVLATARGHTGVYRRQFLKCVATAAKIHKVHSRPVVMNVFCSRKRLRTCSTFTSRFASNSGVWWYRRRFADQATKYTSPCTFLAKGKNRVPWGTWGRIPEL